MKILQSEFQVTMALAGLVALTLDSVDHGLLSS